MHGGTIFSLFYNVSFFRLLLHMVFLAISARFSKKSGFDGRGLLESGVESPRIFRICKPRTAFDSGLPDCVVPLRFFPIDRMRQP